MQAVSPVRGESPQPNKKVGRPRKGQEKSNGSVPAPAPKLPPSRNNEGKRGRPGKGKKMGKRAVTPPATKLPRSRIINQGKIMTNKKKSDLAYEPGDYAVERIVDKRVQNGKVEYLIKWFQWPSSANTWEPVHHLENIKWMVNKYEELSSGLEPVVEKEVIEINSSFSSSSSSSGDSSSALPPDQEPGKAQKEQPPQQRGSKTCFKTLKTNTHRLRLNNAKAAVDNTPKTLVHSVLDECPPGRMLEKIHAVAVVQGNLTFFVQWSEFPNCSGTQAPNDNNSNMVRAACMNIKYPQEVIRFYESKTQFFESAVSPEAEINTANAALQKAKDRQQRNQEEMIKLLEEEEKSQREEKKMLKRKIKVENGEDPSSSSEEDEASAAIKMAKRKSDRYSTRLSDSDLGSTSEEDILLNEELD